MQSMVIREFVLCALRYTRSMDCACNPWIVTQSMDPRFALRNPWIVQIHALRPTYISNIHVIEHNADSLSYS